MGSDSEFIGGQRDLWQGYTALFCRLRPGRGLAGTELRDIVSRRQLDSDLGIMQFVMVVLRNAFSDLRDRYTNNRIRSRVVTGISPQDLDPQHPLL